MTAKMMKNLYPRLAKPTGVTSTTKKLKDHSVPVVMAYMGVRYANGATSVP